MKFKHELSRIFLLENSGFFMTVYGLFFATLKRRPLEEIYRGNVVFCQKIFDFLTKKQRRPLKIPFRTLFECGEKQCI